MVPFQYYLDLIKDERVSGNRKMHLTFRTVPSVVFANGTSAAIQAGTFYQSAPQRNLKSFAGYRSFEVGYATWKLPADIEDTVDLDIWNFCPPEKIQRIVEYNGGIVGWFLDGTVSWFPEISNEEVFLWRLALDISEEDTL